MAGGASTFRGLGNYGELFDQIYLLLQGGPNFSTRPAIEYIYETGFTQDRTGYASALSIVFFLLIVAVSVLLFAGVRRLQRGTP
ncbi:MAG: hypothetical protein ABI611_02770 [Solirubrobacteraceae bacterium]